MQKEKVDFNNTHFGILLYHIMLLVDKLLSLH